MAPVYDKVGSSAFTGAMTGTWRMAGCAYPVQRAYVKVGGLQSTSISVVGSSTRVIGTAANRTQLYDALPYDYDEILQGC